MQKSGESPKGLLDGENLKTRVFECIDQNQDLSAVRHLFTRQNAKYLDEPLSELENQGPCGPNLLVLAIDRDHLEAVRELLLCGVNPNYLTQVGVDAFKSPLEFALDQSEQVHADRNIVELLLLFGAKINHSSQSDDPGEEEAFRLEAYHAAQRDYPDLLELAHPVFSLCSAAIKALNHPKADYDLGHNLLRRMLEALPQRALAIYEWVLAELNRTQMAGFLRKLQPISLKHQSFQLDFLMAIFQGNHLLNAAAYPDFLANVTQREKFRADLCVRLEQLHKPTTAVQAQARRSRLMSVAQLPHQVLHSPRLFASNTTIYTPLMSAIMAGDETQIDEELKRLKDPNQTAMDRGPTALHFAICRGMTSVVRVLLLQGANTQQYYIDPQSSELVGFFECALRLDPSNPARKNIIELLSLFRRLAVPDPQITLKLEKDHHLHDYKAFKAQLNKITEDDFALSLCYTLATVYFAKPPHKRDPDVKLLLERMLDYLHSAEHRLWVLDDFVNSFETLKKPVQIDFLITLSRLFVRGELSREVSLTPVHLCDEKTSPSVFPQKCSHLIEYLKFHANQHYSVDAQSRDAHSQDHDFSNTSLDM